MPPSRIPCLDHGRGIFLSARYPSHPLDPQTSASSPDAAWRDIFLASQPSSATDGHAWRVCCDRR